jgi:hypothetical protein
MTDSPKFDDVARAQRLAAIRVLRGTPEREAQIQAQEDAKARERKANARLH